LHRTNGNICDFSCSGYVPPEYVDAAVISVKFDIFSLGVTIIKIMTGRDGYFRIAEISSSQFVELVRQSVALYRYLCFHIYEINVVLNC
jgi:hypothetical protein